MPPSSWSQSAATTALRKVHSELFRAKRLCEIGWVDSAWYGTPRSSRPPSLVGGGQRPKIHQCGISRNRLTLKSWLCTFLSAVVAADWLQLDGGMET